MALLAARGFSLWEIGFAESVFHIVSLLCEVPSGMAADLLGRKKTLVSGGVCVVLHSLLMAFAPDLFIICVAMGLNALANDHVLRHLYGADLRQPEAGAAKPTITSRSPPTAPRSPCWPRRGLPRQHTGRFLRLFRLLSAERRL